MVVIDVVAAISPKRGGGGGRRYGMSKGKKKRAGARLDKGGMVPTSNTVESVIAIFNGPPLVLYSGGGVGFYGL